MPPPPCGICETATSIDKERTEELLNFREQTFPCVTRFIFNVARSSRETVSKLEKRSIENFETKRIGHVEMRTRSIGESRFLCFAYSALNIRSRKKKRKTRRSFPEALLQTVYVRDLGSEYGANKGDWTRIFNSAKKKLRVLSFDSVGACFQRCFFRDD